MEKERVFYVENLLDKGEKETSASSLPQKSHGVTSIKKKTTLKADKELKSTATATTTLLLSRKDNKLKYPKRKIRRCFNAEQLDYLERCFEDTIYPDGEKKKRIARQLSVSHDRVQVWFQNKRAKSRKIWRQRYLKNATHFMRSLPAPIPPASPSRLYGQPSSYHPKLFDMTMQYQCYRQEDIQPPFMLPTKPARPDAHHLYPSCCSCCRVPQVAQPPRTLLQRNNSHFMTYETNQYPDQRQCKCCPPM